MKLPGLRLRLATSQTIRQWAQRKLPNGKIINGQILSPKTINYLTLKPEKDGLFCERLFGPVQDSICACGRQPQHGQKFCPRCEVEYISPRVRRYRLGYIQLITAAAHVWFFKGRPSYFSLFLNIPPKKIEGLLYCTQNISRTIFPKELENLSLYSTHNPIVPIFLRKYPSKHFEENAMQNSISNFSNSSSLDFPVFTKNKPKKKNRRFYIYLNFSNKNSFKNQKKYNLKFYYLDSNPRSRLFVSISNDFLYKSNNFLSQLVVNSKSWFCKQAYCYTQPFKPTTKAKRVFTEIQQKNLKKDNSFLKKSLWKKGGLRDAALFFGFSLISKRLCWPSSSYWFSFVYFLIKAPKKEDLLNKFYSGPPSLVNLWGFQSRLFCFTGVQLIRTWLTQLTQNYCNDGRLLEIQIRLDLLQLERDETLSDNDFFEKIQLFRRFKYLRAFRHTQMNPASMVLRVLPVLPPDLRPILHLDSNQIAVSDFNKLYQTVIFRNRRLFRLTKDTNFHCLNSEALQYAQRLLQEAVDSLIENDNTSATSRSSRSSSSMRPLKSLSDLFKGKKGRFRQNLLGKRVDYSGRSVIVVGPYLKIYECGLPKEIAYELFQPFLLRILIFQKQAQTILGAKKILKKNPKLVLNLLKEVVHSHPILLNRAPTLHRLSIQAFQPRLVEGRAILLHPLVCSAFNADFDGDQMGVHLPLCFEARAEAWKINWSQNNLFSAATGLPVCSPSQDMILGSSFLTTRNIQKLSFTILKNYLFNKSFNKYKSSINGSQKTKILKKEPVAVSLLTSRHAAAQQRAAAACCWRKQAYCVTAMAKIQIFNTLRINNKTKTVKNFKNTYDKSNFFFSKPYFFNNLDSNFSQDTTRGLAGGVSILFDINKITFTQTLYPFTYSQKQNLRLKTQKDFKSNKLFIKDVNYSNQSPIWYSYNPNINGFETEKKIQKLIEIRIHLNGSFNKFRAEIYQNYHSGGTEIIRKIRTTYSRLKFYNNLLLL